MRIITKILLTALVVVLLSGIALYLIPLPPAFMAKQVANHYSYFFQDEESWTKEHSLAEVIWVKGLEFKLRHDLTGNFESRLKLSSSKPAQTILIATHEVKNLYITQVQEQVPIISNSTLASLVRGYGYCDQLNGFLAFLLSSQLERVELVGISDSIKGEHTVIKTTSQLGAVWVDAFYCLPAFGFEGALTLLGKEKIPLYSSEHAHLFPAASYQKAFTFNEYSLRYSAGKAIHRFTNLFKQKTTHPQQVVVSAVAGADLSYNPARDRQWLENLQNEPIEIKQTFLKARIMHLYGETQEASRLYKTVAEENPNGPLARYATTFLSRIVGSSAPCEPAIN